MLVEFEKKVIDFCKRHELFPGDYGGKVLVALSGGGDSVALLYSLAHISNIFGITIEAAHLNHSLRGEESIRDENFCCKLCAELGIYLTVERLKEGEIHGNEDSIETAARQKRIAFLTRVAADREAVRIATGHTMDDQAETVLHRILRGTGPSGLKGILPVRDNLWVRPLLGMTRKEIRDYLKKEEIVFREDSTNQDILFFRNRIRHELIPFLQEHFSPGITGVIDRLAELSRIQEDYLDEIMVSDYRNCCILENSYKIILDKRKFLDYHKMVKQRLVRYSLELLEGKGRDADMDEVEDVISLFGRDHGTLDITSTLQCGVGGHFAVFVRRAEPFEPIQLEFSGETVIPMGGGCIIAEKAGRNIKADGKMTVLVSQEIIRKYGTLHVGPVKRGEFMIPFGMSEIVKIRALFSASYIPKLLRDSVPVVRAGAVPIWVPGLRSSEYLRTSETENGVPDSRETILLTFKNGICWT